MDLLSWINIGSFADVKIRIKMIAQISSLLGSSLSILILCSFLGSGLVWSLSLSYLAIKAPSLKTNTSSLKVLKGNFTQIKQLKYTKLHIKGNYKQKPC